MVLGGRFMEQAYSPAFGATLGCTVRLSQKKKK